MKAVIINDGVTTGREFAKTINDNFLDHNGKISTLISSNSSLATEVEELMLANTAILSGITDLQQADMVLNTRIDNIPINTGGTTTELYTNLTPTPSALGGWPAGSIFSGATTQYLFDGLFHPYQLPTLSSFAITGQASLVEVGVNLSGSKTFTWTKTNNSNIKPNIGLIRDTISNTVIVSGINVNSLTSFVNALTIDNSSPITKSYRLESENTNNQSIISNVFSFKTIYPVFSGFVTQSDKPLSSAIDIVNSNKRVVISNTDTVFTINSSGSDYSWIAIPQAESSQFTNWFITALNSGNIGGLGNLFGTGESILLTLAGLWSNVAYWIYITNYRTPIASITLKRS